MVQAKVLFLLLLIPAFCQAADLKPWFGNDHETEIRARVLYQNYHSLSSRRFHGRIGEQNDIFLSLSAAYPFKRYCCEFEATVAHTKRQNCRWDNFQIIGRYQWLRERDGDAFSMVTGFILGEAFSRALHDVSSFHHGHLEGQAFFSFGKKYGSRCDNGYKFRWWEITSIGTSDKGSPWVRADAAIEYVYGDAHHFRGLVNTLWGTGDDSLELHHFKGYGRIRHHSVDIGVRYGYETDCWGTVSIQYARRVYASNFPENNNLVLCEYYFPFGIQSFSNY